MQQPIRILIPGESREIYEKIYLAYWAEYKPETPSEADAVEDIINSRWKIRRFESIESNYFAMAGTLYQDNQEYQDSTPDTQQRASFNQLIETQPGFEACARFIERNQKAHSRALRNLDRIRKAAGKPKVEVNANEVEKENPTNTPPNPQPPATPRKDQNKAINPETPKREQGKANIEILLSILLFLSLTVYGHQKLKNEGTVPTVKSTKEAKRNPIAIKSAPSMWGGRPRPQATPGRAAFTADTTLENHPNP